jgi:hypothetical protein
MPLSGGTADAARGYWTQSQRSTVGREATMSSVKFVYWEEDGAWLGYLQDYPDYWTQGESLDDLKEHLKDLYRDITSGEIPGIRRVEELAV